MDTQNRIPADNAENRMAMTDDDFDQLMDDSQVIYGMQAGDIVSQADVDALNRLDTHWRKNADDAVAAYAEGIKTGWQMAGGAEVAELLEKLDQSEIELTTQRAMRRFDEQNLRLALLDNVREEIRDEVAYALELAANTAAPANTGDVSEARPA